MGNLVSKEVKADGEHINEPDISFLKELAQVFQKPEHKEVAKKWGISHHLPDRLVENLIPRQEVMFFSKPNSIENVSGNSPYRSFRRIVEVRKSGTHSYCCDLCWDGQQLYCCGMCD